MPEVKDLVGVTPLLFFFLLCAFVLIKLLPVLLAHRKEIKGGEFETRRLEATARQEQAGALIRLSESLGVMSTTLREIAVEQRRATDSVRLLQRVSADSADSLSQTVASLTERLDELEGKQIAQRSRTGTPTH